MSKKGYEEHGTGVPAFLYCEAFYPRTGSNSFGPWSVQGRLSKRASSGMGSSLNSPNASGTLAKIASGVDAERRQLRRAQQVRSKLERRMSGCRRTREWEEEGTSEIEPKPPSFPNAHPLTAHSHARCPVHTGGPQPQRHALRSVRRLCCCRNCCWRGASRPGKLWVHA